MKKVEGFIFTGGELAGILAPCWGNVEVVPRGVTYVANSKAASHVGYAAWDIDAVVAKHIGIPSVEGYYIGVNENDEDEYIFVVQ